MVVGYPDGTDTWWDIALARHRIGKRARRKQLDGINVVEPEVESEDADEGEDMVLGNEANNRKRKSSNVHKSRGSKSRRG